MGVETKNAVITHTMIGFQENYRVLTYSIGLDCGGLFQNAGGICLGHEGKPADVIFTEHFMGILQALGVDEWEKLSGTPCRVVFDAAHVYKIGHYLKDQWFTITEEKRDGGD